MASGYIRAWRALAAYRLIGLIRRWAFVHDGWDVQTLNPGLVIPWRANAKGNDELVMQTDTILVINARRP